MSMAAGVAIGANLAGQTLSRFGYAREMAVGGLLVAGAGLAWLGNMPIDAPAGQIFAVTLVMGIGMSFSFTTLHIPVQNAMPDELLGVVTSALQFFRTFGMVIGAVGLGALLLAQLGAFEAEGPSAHFADPEVLVSADRLEGIEQEFLDDPNLGCGGVRNGTRCGAGPYGRSAGYRFSGSQPGYAYSAPRSRRSRSAAKNARTHNRTNNAKGWRYLRAAPGRPFRKSP